MTLWEDHKYPQKVLKRSQKIDLTRFPRTSRDDFLQEEVQLNTFFFHNTRKCTKLQNNVFYSFVYCCLHDSIWFTLKTFLSIANFRKRSSNEEILQIKLIKYKECIMIKYLQMHINGYFLERLSHKLLLVRFVS